MISKLTLGGVSWTHIPEIRGEMKETLCDYTHAEEVLGWKPKRNLEEWLKEQLV